MTEKVSTATLRQRIGDMVDYAPGVIVTITGANWQGD
jgi:hypothetical protein